MRSTPRTRRSNHVTMPLPRRTEVPAPTPRLHHDALMAQPKRANSVGLTTSRRPKHKRRSRPDARTTCRRPHRPNPKPRQPNHVMTPERPEHQISECSDPECPDVPNYSARRSSPIGSTTTRRPNRKHRFDISTKTSLEYTPPMPRSENLASKKLKTSLEHTPSTLTP